MPTPAQNSQLRNAELGFRVQGAIKTIPNSGAGTTTIFTVSGGRIMVALLYGVVTTAVTGTTPNFQFKATPTVGTANNMSAAGAITAAEAGAHIVCPVAVGTATIVVPGASGSSTGPGLGGQVVAPGTIGILTSAADTAGAAQFTLFYIPLDPATTVAAN